jgi:hypothetical protein
MEHQSVHDPNMRSKGESSVPVPLNCLSHATHLKKLVGFVEEDISHLCSAFLAERGCLS